MEHFFSNRIWDRLDSFFNLIGCMVKYRIMVKCYVKIHRPFLNSFQYQFLRGSHMQGFLVSDMFSAYNSIPSCAFRLVRFVLTQWDHSIHITVPLLALLKINTMTWEFFSIICPYRSRFMSFFLMASSCIVWLYHSVWDLYTRHLHT